MTRASEPPSALSHEPAIAASAARRVRALDGPALVGLATYAVSLALILVLYHFQ